MWVFCGLGSFFVWLFWVFLVWGVLVWVLFVSLLESLDPQCLASGTAVQHRLVALLFGQSCSSCHSHSTEACRDMLARRAIGQDAAAKGRRALTHAAFLPLCSLTSRGDGGIKIIFTVICNYIYTI